MKKVFFSALGMIVGLEILSLCLALQPLAQSIITLVLTVALFIITLRKPGLGLAVLASEYILGSKGYLFRYELTPDPDRGLSIRILFFTVFSLAWLILAIKYKWWKGWLGYLKGREAYLLLSVVFVFSFLRGLWLHNPFTLADANAWASLVLILPILDFTTRAGFFKEDWDNLKAILLAALVFSITQTLFLFYFFSHGFPIEWTDYVYRWIRRTGVGEVTRILPGQSAFRVFFQSHIYEVLAFGGLAATLLKPWSWKRAGLLAGSFAVVIISFSRSFWIGLAAMLLLVGVGVLMYLIKASGWKIGIQKLLVWKGSILATIIAGMLIVLALFAFPYPKGGSGSFADLLLARADTGEDAAQSRWKLLPILWNKIKQAPILGHGFGATVTYESKDPRIVEKFGGRYTTYAFEWGWVDFWVKFGVLGIPVMLFVLIQLGLRVWRSQTEFTIRLGLVAVLIGLASVHVFTPYLNHPLGFMVLLGMEAYLAQSMLIKKTST